MVEHRTVDAGVVGSRPIWHPEFDNFYELVLALQGWDRSYSSIWVIGGARMVGVSSLTMHFRRVEKRISTPLLSRVCFPV